MKKYLPALAVALFATGCTSTGESSEYGHLPVTESELQAEKWSGLNRFPPRYPESAAMRGTEGCATVAYVITPQNEVKDIQVVTATQRDFGQSAAMVVERWSWSDMPAGIVTEPVKTQTRFDFCMDSSNQNCTTVTPDYSCPGDDIIYSRGMR